MTVETMKEIALAGLVMTVDEWQSLDGESRAEIVAAVMSWEREPSSPGIAIGELDERTATASAK